MSSKLRTVLMSIIMECRPVVKLMSMEPGACTTFWMYSMYLSSAAAVARQ